METTPHTPHQGPTGPTEPPEELPPLEPVADEDVIGVTETPPSDPKPSLDGRE